MKLGQTLSLQTDILPAETLVELSKLQTGAPPMHESLMRAVFRGEFGREPEQVFRRFDTTPFAAASMGQVHSAVTRDGQRVAVKIQYPAIQEAIQSDFAWFRAVSKPIQLSQYLPSGVLDEMERQFLEETDYAVESKNLELFRSRIEELRYVEIPRVFPDLSRKRILTMSFVDGMHLDDFLATNPPQSLRDKIGEELLELFYFQIMRLEALHADPHWGNYLFRADGSVGLVDFGCVKRLRHEFVENTRAVSLYPGRRDSPEFQRLLEKRYEILGTRLSAPARQALVRFTEAFYRKVYPPDKASEAVPIDFANPDLIRDFMREAGNLANRRGTAPGYIFVARAEVGLYQTLHRLRARVRTSAIVRRWL
jgi:predicted unusual protein kinase regulating ubiquinone biosynthesis (AarF/ABC1/UbiB family)